MYNIYVTQLVVNNVTIRFCGIVKHKSVFRAVGLSWGIERMRSNCLVIFYHGLKGTLGFFCLFEQTSNKYAAEMQTAFILRREAIQRNIEISR